MPQPSTAVEHCRSYCCWVQSALWITITVQQYYSLLSATIHCCCTRVWCLYSNTAACIYAHCGVYGSSTFLMSYSTSSRTSYIRYVRMYHIIHGKFSEAHHGDGGAAKKPLNWSFTYTAISNNSPHSSPSTEISHFLPYALPCCLRTCRGGGGRTCPSRCSVYTTHNQQRELAGVLFVATAAAATPRPCRFDNVVPPRDRNAS